MFMASRPRGEATHTVLVSDVPGVWADTKSKVKDIKKSRRDASKSTLHKKNDDGSSRHSDDSAVAVAYESAEERLLQKNASAEIGPVAGVDSYGAKSAPRPVAKAKDDDVAPAAGSVDVSAVHIEDKAAKEDALAGTFMVPPVRHHFDYDPEDEALMPKSIATRIIAAGVPITTMVENEFDTVYPGEVDEVQLVKDQTVLWPYYTEYTKIKQNLEDYLDECNHRLDNGLKVWCTALITACSCPTRLSACIQFIA